MAFELLGMSSTSWGLWFFIAAVFYLGKKLPGIKDISKAVGGAGKAAMFVLIIGVFATGAISGFGSSSASISGNIALSDVTLSNGNLNGTTTADYYSAGDSVVTFYMDDTMTIDDGQINFTVSLDRIETADAGSILVTCGSSDFSKSGNTYNIVSKDIDEDIELTIDGAGKSQDQSVSKMVDFGVGVSTTSFVVEWKNDEAGEDILSAKDTKNINCKADGQNFGAVIVIND
jgi:hypothetical protein